MTFYVRIIADHTSSQALSRRFSPLLLRSLNEKNLVYYAIELASE